MGEFVGGVAASAAVVGAVWVLYGLVYVAHARRRATAACYWLPTWRCFRLVIRNMDGRTPITTIRYRAWLREARPATGGSSVISWLDREIASGERILLPPREDLTVVSFRSEHGNSQPTLVLTDKFGAVNTEIALRPEDARLMLEYSLRLRTWFLFKVDVSRVYELVRYDNDDGKTDDTFATLLPSIQKGGEMELDRIRMTDQSISISL